MWATLAWDTAHGTKRDGKNTELHASEGIGGKHGRNKGPRNVRIQLRPCRAGGRWEIVLSRKVPHKPDRFSYS